MAKSMTQNVPILTPEMLIPRLGEYLVQNRLISELDLQKALTYQQEQIAKGKNCLLGQALLELKLIAREPLDQAITEQILQLRSALTATNRNLEQRVKERTEELNAAIQRLSELSQMKANFVSNISHELRTPLTHLKGYLGLLVAGSLGEISEEQQQALQVSQNACSKLEGMIEDLIMFALTTRGKLGLKLQTVDVRKVVNLAVNFAMPKAEERGVLINAVIDDNVPSVQADSEKISWALNHLIDNGIKFTPAGGRVMVSVKPDGENLVTISVSDTGIGIPASRLEEVFEPFHQLDGSSTRRYSGAGLGLSLVRQIVEAHGSMLDVHSVEGKGSTFKFPLLAMK